MALKAVFCVFYCMPTGRFLFELRGPDVNNPNTYGLFGGGIDKGETPKQAMIRELREEIGFNVSMFHCKIDTPAVRLYGIKVTSEFSPKLSWESAGFLWSTKVPKPTHKRIVSNRQALRLICAALQSN